MGLFQGVPVPLSQGERLESRGLPSGTGSFLRHGAHFRTASSCAIPERGVYVSFNKGGPIMHRELKETERLLSGMACILRVCLCISGTGSAVFHGERLRAWSLWARSTEPGGSVLVAQILEAWCLRHCTWKPGARGTELGCPVLAAQNLEARCSWHRAWRLHGILCLPLSLTFPWNFCAEATEPGCCLGFCVSCLSVLPLQFLQHWECRLQSLGMTTAVTRSNCRH